MEVLAIIPARSGSKSVINKNIREVAGRPMLAWSVEHALKSRLINRVIVSTDSEEYAEIARKYGAETPFIRPEEYATDTSLDLEVFQHALGWLKENEDYVPDIVVQLRPTYPKRNPEDIDKMIEMLLADAEADSVRSVALAGEVPYKMWLAGAALRDNSDKSFEGQELVDERTVQQVHELPEGSAVQQDQDRELPEGSAVQQDQVRKLPEGNAVQQAQDRELPKGSAVQSPQELTETGTPLGCINPLITTIPECYNMPRQALPVVYYQNACIDVARATTITEKNSMNGTKILGYLMSDNLDIDTEIELLRAENKMLREKLAEK